MAIQTQKIRELNTVSEVPSGSKLLLTPDNGLYARATVPSIVGSAMETGDFNINSTTNKVELKERTFTGTTDAWEALTAAQKAQYTYVNLTDDGSSGSSIEIDDEPTEDSENAVSSGGVYDALATLESNFQDGCDTIVSAVTAKGQTPTSNSPTDIATAIGNIETGSPKYTINITTELSDFYGEDITATYTDSGNTIEITSAFSNNGTATIDIYDYTGTVTIASGTKSYTVTIVSGTDTYSVEFANIYEINVSTTESSLYGETVTATYDTNKTVTATLSNEGTATITIKNYEGTVELSATDGTNTAETTITIVSGVYNYIAGLAFISIYGVSWAGGTDTSMTRTDKAASFSNPSPAVNNGNGSSPFDNLYPWNGMEIVDDSTGGKLVSIPKYYYKWTKTGNAMTLQIADKPTEGFLVSPAHADRGDGKGERDVVYVGRYHCASDYKSKTGVQPQASVTRANFRTNIHNLGSTYWQYDFAMYWTIMMLYLVEYADWNSQKVIGYGCSDSGSKQNMGLTDSMTYHTGTNAANRTTYGHTQYRHIEDLWGNVYDWCDGIYFSSANVYCIKNPSNFSDSSGGTLVGTRPTSGGYISAWNVPTASGFEYALYPSAVNGGEATYIGDYCYYISGGVVLHVGGYYSQGQYYGAFCLSGDYSASNSYQGIGGRLQKLP